MGNKVKEIKSNLRWPGGKSKMTKILKDYFPDNIDKYLEIFTGGGSVLLYIIQNYNPKIIFANDIDDKLINYYQTIKLNPQQVIDECMEIKNNYNYQTFRDIFYNLNRNIASHFFISNKTSFSGLNNNYSEQAYDRNFSVNCIKKINDISNVIQNTNFLNYDFININDDIIELNDIDDIIELNDFFIYLDPPYYGNKKNGLYGDKGKLHKEFNHDELFNWVEKYTTNNKIMISYDDSPYIRELYKNYNIYNFDFKYSMTNTGGNLCKTGNEIIITNYLI